MRIALWCAVVCSAAYAGETGAASFVISTAAGGTYCGDGRAATAAYLGAPDGLAADAQGNLYIADSSDHRVRKIDAEGLITTIAGNGYAGFRGDGGPAVTAELNAPYGLAVDASGNVYIADLGNARVRKVSPDGTIATVAGGAATGGVTLTAPRNLALDTAGNLYISDFGANRVYRLTTAGKLEVVAGSGDAGSLADGYEVQADLAALNAPAGLAVRNGTLYIADSGNQRIRKVSGGMMSTVETTGAAFTLPVGLALDAKGVLYVADKSAAVVRRITADAADAVAGTGTAGNSGDGGAATAARLTAPREIAFDAAGNLYIGDSVPGDPYPVGMVRRVIATGIIDTVAGGLEYRPLGDTGAPEEAHLESPSGVAVASDGALYIADRLDHRVRKVAAGIITTFAGAPELYEPAALAVDAAGNVRVADAAGHRVWTATAAGTLSLTAGLPDAATKGYSGDGDLATAARLNAPEGVAVDAAGNVYIADTANHAIREVTVDGIIVTIAGSGIAGNTGDGGPAYAARLRSPAGVAFDRAGNLYVADTGNHRVRKIDVAGAISTVAGDGTAGFAGDGGAAKAAHLRSPRGLAFDAAGNLYIADAGNHRIRRVTQDGTLRTIAGTGTAGWGGDGGPALAAELNEPVGLSFDTLGNLYAADRGNHRVRKLAPSSVAAPLLDWNLVNTASQVAGPIAPGELVSLLGAGLGPSDPVPGRVLDTGLLSTTLVATQVRFNGTPAPLLSVSYSQINVQVPYEVEGSDSIEIELWQNGAITTRLVAAGAKAVPAVFTVEGGTGQVSATNEDGSLNSTANPAAPGSIVTFFATGEGQTRAAGVSGRPSAAPYPVPVQASAVRIGGRAAEVLFAGSAPGYVGLLQINARIPKAAAAGAQPVVLQVGSAASPAGVTIAVR
jgi:uncharacterized protein (TIGR03437 family)